MPDEASLVVEVDFDTDPNAPGFRRDVVDAINQALAVARQEDLHVDENEAPLFITKLRIVPRRQG